MKLSHMECEICGMIFINIKELARHRELVHPTNNDEKMFQCQSCSMFFDSEEEFAKHALETHSEKSNFNIAKTVTEDIMKKGRAIENKKQDNNNTENRLLKQTNLEKRARKRTRGPYRKSSL
jgi:uncharacterized C2H2 Zn-finger protein